MPIQLFISETEPSANQMKPITNRLHIKPHGGIWTSTWNEETRSSGWTEWCEAEEYRDTSKLQWWLLTPLEQLRIYTVDTLRDLHMLAKHYQLPHDYIKRARKPLVFKQGMIGILLYALGTLLDIAL